MWFLVATYLVIGIALDRWMSRGPCPVCGDRCEVRLPAVLVFVLLWGPAVLAFTLLDLARRCRGKTP